MKGRFDIDAAVPGQRPGGEGRQRRVEEIRCKGRVEENQVKRRGAIAQKPSGIAADDLRPAGGIQHGDVLLKGPARPAGVLNKNGTRRPARERLEAERSTAGKQIQHPRAINLPLEPVEKGLAVAIGGRPQPRAAGESQPTTPPLPANDP